MGTMTKNGRWNVGPYAVTRLGWLVGRSVWTMLFMCLGQLKHISTKCKLSTLRANALTPNQRTGFDNGGPQRRQMLSNVRVVSLEKVDRPCVNEDNCHGG